MSVLLKGVVENTTPKDFAEITMFNGEVYRVKRNKLWFAYETDDGVIFIENWNKADYWNKVNNMKKMKIKKVTKLFIAINEREAFEVAGARFS